VPIDFPPAGSGAGGIPLPAPAADAIVVYPRVDGADADGGPAASEGEGVTLAVAVQARGSGGRRDERHGTVEGLADFTVLLPPNDPEATGLDYRDVGTDWRVDWAVATGESLSAPIRLATLGPARPPAGTAGWELDCRRVG
jgi:hypothetical protein